MRNTPDGECYEILNIARSMLEGRFIYGFSKIGAVFNIIFDKNFERGQVYLEFRCAVSVVNGDQEKILSDEELVLSLLHGEGAGVLSVDVIDTKKLRIECSSGHTYVFDDLDSASEECSWVLKDPENDTMIYRVVGGLIHVGFVGDPTF